MRFPQLLGDSKLPIDLFFIRQISHLITLVLFLYYPVLVFFLFLIVYLVSANLFKNIHQIYRTCSLKCDFNENAQKLCKSSFVVHHPISMRSCCIFFQVFSLRAPLGKFFCFFYEISHMISKLIIISYITYLQI